MRLAPDYPLTVARVPTLGGNPGTFATVRVMRAMVEQFKSDPDILRAAVGVIYLTPEHSQYGEAETLFNYVRDFIRYVRDPVGLESLTIPPITLQRQIGDCDDQATLLATLFEAVGYPSRFVLAGYQSRDFEHVFLEVFVNGEWIACDPILKTFNFGDEAPGALARWTERR